MPFVRVRGRSMIPTLRPGDILWAGPPQSLERGDIVLINKPSLFIKRIVGLPGETVALKAGGVSVNNARLPEPYVAETAALEPQKDQTFQLPASTYLVLGDARDDSLDSRRLGPVEKNEIKGVVRHRLWPLARWGPMAVFLLVISAAGPARAQENGAKLLAFASETHLAMMIGKYDPKKGWVNAWDFYQPPSPGDTFTLYGPSGFVGEVTITEDQSAYRRSTFADWNAKVSHWDYRQTPYALAVSGSSPLSVPPLEALPLDGPEYETIVADYLGRKGLHVDHPLLNQAIDISPDGHAGDEAVLVAHSDESTLTDDAAAEVYALVLLCWKDQGKQRVMDIASAAYHKPRGRSIAEMQQYHGVRPFYRVIGAVDIDGDGWKEIAVYNATGDTTQVSIFHFDGRRLTKVLSTLKAG